MDIKPVKEARSITKRIICYFWVDNKEKRISWFFQTEEQARHWLGRYCRNYFKYPIIEDFVKQFPKDKWEEKQALWKKDKEYWDKHELRKAEIRYGM